MEGVLFETHRPTSLDEMVGHETQRKALEVAITTGGSHAIMLSGPQGVGKTTMARIAARMLGAERMEVAAAVNTGIDEMREVLGTVRHRSLEADYRVVILDEAHRLSKNAWDSALKIIEEPPEHLFWFLCTTEPAKVPKTIIDRCLHLRLKPLPHDELLDLLERVADAEGFDTENETLRECATYADGSARGALVNLAATHSMNWRQARDLLREGGAVSSPVIKLCRLLIQGGIMGGVQTDKWLQAQTIIANIQEEPENVRIAVVNYIAKCLQNAKSEREVIALLGILERFSTPYHPGEKTAPLLLSVGRALLMGA